MSHQGYLVNFESLFCISLDGNTSVVPARGPSETTPNYKGVVVKNGTPFRFEGEGIMKVPFKDRHGRTGYSDVKSIRSVHHIQEPVYALCTLDPKHWRRVLERRDQMRSRLSEQGATMAMAELLILFTQTGFEFDLAFGGNDFQPNVSVVLDGFTLDFRLEGHEMEHTAALASANCAVDPDVCKVTSNMLADQDDRCTLFISLTGTVSATDEAAVRISPKFRPGNGEVRHHDHTYTCDGLSDWEFGFQDNDGKLLNVVVPDVAAIESYPRSMIALSDLENVPEFADVRAAKEDLIRYAKFLGYNELAVELYVYNPEPEESQDASKGVPRRRKFGIRYLKTEVEHPNAVVTLTGLESTANGIITIDAGNMISWEYSTDLTKPSPFAVREQHCADHQHLSPHASDPEAAAAASPEDAAHGGIAEQQRQPDSSALGNGHRIMIMGIGKSASGTASDSVATTAGDTSPDPTFTIPPPKTPDHSSAGSQTGEGHVNGEESDDEDGHNSNERSGSVLVVMVGDLCLSEPDQQPAARTTTTPAATAAAAAAGNDPVADAE